MIEFFGIGEETASRFLTFHLLNHHLAAIHDVETRLGGSRIESPSVGGVPCGTLRCDSFIGDSLDAGRREGNVEELFPYIGLLVGIQ